MKWTAEIRTPKILHCTIEHIISYMPDGSSNSGGYYLDVVGDGVTYDDHQDTLEFAKEAALEDFGVPLDAWQQIE